MACSSAAVLAVLLVAPSPIFASVIEPPASSLRGGQAASKAAVRVYGMGVLYDGIGLHMNTGEQIKDPVLAAIEDFAVKWVELRDASKQGDGMLADGAAASHSKEAREEAAAKLIGNHETVLRDVTSPLRPRSQPELIRVPMIDAQFADQALREVARRLLGRREGMAIREELSEAATAGHATAWVLTANYLSGRIQANSVECPSRPPDMSEAAAAAMRAVLKEIGETAQQLLEAHNVA